MGNEKSVPIVQHGGEEKHVLGKLELVFQKKDGKMKLVNFSGSEYDIEFVQEDEKVREIIEEYREKLRNIPVIRKSA